MLAAGILYEHDSQGLLEDARRQRKGMKPGTCVLIVEDDPYIARLLRLQLEHRDLRTRCEYDGPSGLKAVAEFDPRLAFFMRYVIHCTNA